MALLVCYVSKFKQLDIGNAQIHYNRVPGGFDALTGKDGNPETDYLAAVEERIKVRYTGKRAIRLNAIRLVSVLISSERNFFRTLDSMEVKQFFHVAAVYLTECFGRDNVIAAKVHLDERPPHMHFSWPPHMHFSFVPLKDGRLNASSLINRKLLLDIHESLPKVLREAGFDITRRKYEA